MGKYAESIRKEVDSVDVTLTTEDITDVIYLTKELMRLMLKDCVEKYPQAYVSIQQMESAVWQLGMLENWVEEELKK